MAKTVTAISLVTAANRTSSPVPTVPAGITTLSLPAGTGDDVLMTAAIGDGVPMPAGTADDVPTAAGVGDGALTPAGTGDDVW